MLKIFNLDDAYLFLLHYAYQWENREEALSNFVEAIHEAQPDEYQSWIEGISVDDFAFIWKNALDN